MEFDEYAYLEQQLEGGGNGHPSHGPPPEDRRDKRRDRDEKRRSRSRSRERRSARDDKGRRDDRDRDRVKERRDRENERDRGYGRGPERDRPRDYKEPRDFARDRPPREESYARPPPRRAGTPPEVRALREQEKELKEMERLSRTVFAYNLNVRAEEKDLFQFFSIAGRVMDVKVITDKNTKRSKGFAYIEYSRPEEVLVAVALTGQMFMGQAIMVKPSEHEKNLQWEAQQQAKQNQAAAQALLGTAGAGTGPAKLAVTNLSPAITERDLSDLFSPFGTLESVQLMRDVRGAPTGAAYVQYSNMLDATKAMQHWHQRDLGGIRLAVQLVQTAVPGGDAAYAGGIGELDEEEARGGLKLTSDRRQALMNRLASSAGLQAPPSLTYPAAQAPPAAQPKGPPVPQDIMLQQGLCGPPSPIPTTCILIKNMFNPQEETGDNWPREIQEDVSQECSKYGTVVHAYVDPNSKGFVYLKFSTPQGAMAAQQSLNGRYFSGRPLVAEFEFEHAYRQVFHV